MSDYTVLVPVDGSDHASAGLEYACTTYTDATLLVVHVVSPGLLPREGISSFDDVERRVDEARERTTQILEEARELAGKHGREVSTDVAFGHPPAAITEYATQEDVDHIILGSRGESADLDRRLGSVAEAVLRDAPTLVTIVR